MTHSVPKPVLEQGFSEESRFLQALQTLAETWGAQLTLDAAFQISPTPHVEA